MEQQLAAMNWKPQDFENRIHELEQECTNKDRQIRDLGAQVDEQVLPQCCKDLIVYACLLSNFPNFIGSIQSRVLYCKQHKQSG